MRRGSGISLLLGVAAFVVVGLFTKDWGTAAAIGLGLAGFGGLGLAGLGKMGKGGTMPGQGPSQGPSQQPTQPKSPGRSNEI